MRKAPPLVAKSAHSPTTPPTAVRRAVSLVAGGDIDLARELGRQVLKEPTFDPLQQLHPYLKSADIRFANLESTISEQHGSTVAPWNPLVFTAPPQTIGILKNAKFDVLSTANNHAWDYGKPALFESQKHLTQAGIKFVGTGESIEQANAPVIIEQGGQKIAFLAGTEVWNQGPLPSHPAREFVAHTKLSTMIERIHALKANHHPDWIIVSFHGGDEYLDFPLRGKDVWMRAVIDAGADIVLGHHPHTVQGIVWHHQKPLFYSLGNLLMRMNQHHLWTGFSFLTNITLFPTKKIAVKICPFLMMAVTPVPLASIKQRSAYENMFYTHIRAISKGESVFGPVDQQGCSEVRPSKPTTNPNQQPVTPHPKNLGGGWLRLRGTGQHCHYLCHVDVLKVLKLKEKVKFVRSNQRSGCVPTLVVGVAGSLLSVRYVAIHSYESQVPFGL
jgi:poly-gamma-glutamate capsule biosynthesis protein CapA/YwtB (metallophosphatase superfamily)